LKHSVFDVGICKGRPRFRCRV